MLFYQLLVIRSSSNPSLCATIMSSEFCNNVQNYACRVRLIVYTTAGASISRLEAKVLLFHLLRNFSLSLSDRMRPGPIVWDRSHFNKIEGGCWLKLTKRNQ